MLPKIFTNQRNLILLINLFIAFLCNCPSNKQSNSTKNLPTQIIYNFKLYESTTGSKLYLVTAQKAYVYNQQQKIEVENPYVVFFDDNGFINSTLRSLNGCVNTANSNLVARDSVIVKTKDSTFLYTDSLLWDNQAQLIITDAWVNIESKQGNIAGQGLISDAALKKIEIKSSVTGKTHYEFK